MRFKLLLILILFSVAKVSFGQNYHHNVFWLRLALADTINKKTKLELFLQKRTQGISSDQSNMFRSSLYNSIWFWVTFTLSKSSKVSVSPIGYFENYTLNAKPLDENKPPVKEYRFSVRYTNEQKGRIVNYSNRYSIEYRLRDLEYNGIFRPNFRTRYMAKLEKPVYGLLTKNKPVTFELHDELFIQFGRAVHNNPNVFDQNRLYVGFNYEIFKNFELDLGYIYVFQERKSGEEFDNVNMVWLVLTFDNLFSQFAGKGKH